MGILEVIMEKGLNLPKREIERRLRIKKQLETRIQEAKDKKIWWKGQKVAEELGEKIGSCFETSWKDVHRYQEDFFKIEYSLSYDSDSDPEYSSIEIEFQNERVFHSYGSLKTPEIYRPGKWEERLDKLYAPFEPKPVVRKKEFKMPRILTMSPLAIKRLKRDFKLR